MNHQDTIDKLTDAQKLLNEALREVTDQDHLRDVERLLTSASLTTRVASRLVAAEMANKLRDARRARMDLPPCVVCKSTEPCGCDPYDEEQEDDLHGSTVQ